MTKGDCMERKSNSPTYTKKHLAQYLAKSCNTNLADSAQWVDRVLCSLRDIMVSARPELRIEIRDFGVFEVKLTKSKPKARNPRTGEIICVPPRRKTHFKPSKLLKSFLSKPLDGKLGSSVARDFPSAGSMK